MEVGGAAAAARIHVRQGRNKPKEGGKWARRTTANKGRGWPGAEGRRGRLPKPRTFSVRRQPHAWKRDSGATARAAGCVGREARREMGAGNAMQQIRTQWMWLLQLTGAGSFPSAE